MKNENVDKFVSLYELLKEKHPFRANQLRSLINNYTNCNDEDKKQSLYRKILRTVRDNMESQLDKKYAKELTNIAVTYNELTYTFENSVNKAKPNCPWRVRYNCIERLSFDGEKVFTLSKIDRIAGEGFVIPSDDTAKKLIEERSTEISIISSVIDRRDELINNTVYRDLDSDKRIVWLCMDILGIEASKTKTREQLNSKPIIRHIHR